MKISANQTFSSCQWPRLLRKSVMAALLTLPLSACAIYPDPPPAEAYDGAACCYSYYEYPYPYYYGPVVELGFHDDYRGGGYHHWR